MMKRGRIITERKTGIIGVLAILATAAFLSTCGGGGGDGGGGVAPLPPPSGGPRPTAAALSSGMFLGQGSVIVNGVDFSTTTGTTITIDDASAAESDLRIGMTLKVRGTFGPTTLTGSAQSVDAEPQLIGPVAAPGGTAVFTVLGQSVSTDTFTIFDGISRTPAAGTQLEVYGTFTGPNTILATYIRAGNPAKIQIRGIISRPADTIGTQQVNIAALVPVPQNGDFVEVEGNPVLVGGVIQATRVEIEDVAAESSGREIEIEGSVAAGSVTPTGFSLLTASGPVAVSFGAATRFEDEDNAPVSSGAVLAAGNQVEVEGIMGATGILAAAEIELERKENVVLEGTVTGGTLFGLTLSQALANGTHVEVGGSVVQGSGPPFTINVIRVTQIADPLRAGNLVLQGPVADVNAIDNTFSILGIPIDLTGVQERDDPVLGLPSEFENAANIRIDRGNFMALLRSGVSVVKAKAVADAVNPPFNTATNTFNPRSGVEIEEHR